MLTPLNAWTLRGRLSLLAGAVVGLVMAAFGIGAIWHLGLEVTTHFDQELTRTAQSVLDGWEKSHHDLKLGESISVVPLYYAQIEQPEGHVVYRSRVDGVPPLPPDLKAPIAAVSLGDGELRWATQRKDGMVARVAANNYIVYETIEDLVLLFLSATPAAAILAVIGAHWFLRRAFRPLDVITHAVQDITADRLDGRLPAPRVDDELGRLTGVINDTIDRLERSFRQSARFAADASHELRTPLTLLRTEIEHAVEMPDLPEHCQLVLGRLMEYINDLCDITESLLLLSRADSGKLLRDPQPIELSTLFLELKEDLEALAGEAELDVEVDLTPDSWVLGDGPLLRHLAYNLFENAVKYNQPRGRVRVVLEPHGDSHCLSVGNTGPGIDPAQAPLLFERFFRTDPTREQIRGHGLGLSLCREIARAHHGDVQLCQAEPGWTVFYVTLPAAAGPVLEAPEQEQ